MRNRLVSVGKNRILVLNRIRLERAVFRHFGSP